jgi:hypothetical protein
MSAVWLLLFSSLDVKKFGELEKVARCGKQFDLRCVILSKTIPDSKAIY